MISLKTTIQQLQLLLQLQQPPQLQLQQQWVSLKLSLLCTSKIICTQNFHWFKEIKDFGHCGFFLENLKIIVFSWQILKELQSETFKEKQVASSIVLFSLYSLEQPTILLLWSKVKEKLFYHFRIIDFSSNRSSCS